MKRATGGKFEQFKRKIAFTLVEVVIAMAVVSIALVSICGLLIVGLKETEDSRAQTTAALISRDAMMRTRESITNLETTKLPAGGQMYSNNFYYTDAGQLTNNATGALYLASTVVSGVGTTPNPANASGSWNGQLASLTVSVRWPLDGQGNPINSQNEIDFVTQIAKSTDTSWPTVNAKATTSVP